MSERTVWPLVVWVSPGSSFVSDLAIQVALGHPHPALSQCNSVLHQAPDGIPRDQVFGLNIVLHRFHQSCHLAPYVPASYQGPRRLR